MVGLAGVGVALRLYAMLAAPTVIPHHLDAIRYTRPLGLLFTDYFMPAGYTAFLGSVRGLTDELWITVLIQHGFGIASALFLYGAVKRLTGSRWPGLIPAAVVLLSGDMIYIEHSLLPESFLITLLSAGVYCAIRGIQGAGIRWLFLGGAAFALAGLVRSNALALLPLLILMVALAPGQALTLRLRAAACVAAPAAVIICGYLALATAHGPYSGLVDFGGWNLYGRVAPFADCSKFDPPDDLKSLCETTPPVDRPGPYYYTLADDAPALKLFGGIDPEANSELSSYAMSVIVHQPLDYALAVGKDLARYVNPDFLAERQSSGTGLSPLSFRTYDPVTEQEVATALEDRYSGVDLNWTGAVGGLELEQGFTQLSGALIPIAGLLAIASLILSRGRERWGAILLFLMAIALYVGPVMALSWDHRYGIPPAAFLSAVAGIGVFALVRAIRLPQKDQTGPGPESPRS